jgi:CubicO group peptidase (beta-lactamase class C family)
MTMAAMQVPGVSIAVVQEGRLVYVEGFGVRDVAGHERVTTQTRFMIGSTTKALTSLMIARLVDQKRLTWAVRIRDLLKEFELADESAAQQLNLKHAISCSSGMPKQNMEFLFKHLGITPEARIAQMRKMRPTTLPGMSFQYSNLMAAAGGYAAARAFAPTCTLEEAFRAAVTELVFKPLGMKDSFLRQEDALEGNAAHPHARDWEGRTCRIPMELEMSLHSVAPAGGAWSTAPDLAKYLQLELANGRMPDGTRLICEELLLDRRKQNVRIDAQSSYGLGLIISDQRGILEIHHGGNTMGFSSDLRFFPEKGFGFVVLTNLFGATYFLSAIGQRLVEIAFGADLQAEEIVQAAGKRATWTARINSTVTTDPVSMSWLDFLLGTYWNEDLGSAEISWDHDSYWIQFDEWHSALGANIDCLGNRKLFLTTPPWGDLGLELSINDIGELALIRNQIQYVFHKKQ